MFKQGQAEFDELKALRVELVRDAADERWGGLSRRLLVVVDGLEDAMKEAAGCEEVCEYTDATNALRDYYCAQSRLVEAARGVASACRLALHKATASDRASL